MTRATFQPHRAVRKQEIGATVEAQTPAVTQPVDVFERTAPGAQSLLAVRAAAKPKHVSPIEARRIAGARDEMLDSQGRVRRHYRAVWPLVKEMSRARMKRSLRASKLAFRGDNAMHPIPRLLTSSEFNKLEKGVEQRGTAIRKFLADHYSGEKTYQSLIPEEVVQRIIQRNDGSGFEALVRPDQVSFPYGPDIMRAKDGNFYVIEDNPGYIGGPGDLLLARDLLFDLSPELEAELKPLDDPKDYYTKLIADAKKRAIPAGGKLVIVIEPSLSSDNEDSRVKKIMQEHGVAVVSPYSKLQFEGGKDGLFLKDKSAPNDPPEPVGFVFLNGEHKWLDASHPATRLAYLKDIAEGALEDPKLAPTKRTKIQLVMPQTGEPELKALEKVLKETGLLTPSDLTNATVGKGLVEALASGKVASNYSAGVDFIGDKEFKGFVDDLVRFYLKEEPLLPSIPVHRFTKLEQGKHVFDQTKLDALIKDYQKYVFKIVDGRGGVGIYIGPKMKPEDVPPLVEKIKAEPERYVAEPYTQPSTLAGHIVDLRMIAQVGPDEVVVSPTPWSRGVSIDGDGKVNLSQNGVEFPVVIVKDPPKARKAHRGLRPFRAPNRPNRAGKTRAPQLMSRPPSVL